MDVILKIAVLVSVCTLTVCMGTVDGNAECASSHRQIITERAPVAQPPLSATERIVLETRKAAYKDSWGYLSQVGVGPRWPASHMLRRVPSPKSLTSIPLPVVRPRTGLLWRSEPAHPGATFSPRSGLLWRSEPTIPQGEISPRTKLLWGAEPTTRAGTARIRGGRKGESSNSVTQGTHTPRIGVTGKGQLKSNELKQQGSPPPRSGVDGEPNRTLKHGTTCPR